MPIMLIYIRAASHAAMTARAGRAAFSISTFYWLPCRDIATSSRKWLIADYAESMEYRFRLIFLARCGMRGRAEKKNGFMGMRQR